MKVPPSLPSLTDARRAVEVARAMLAAWTAPVCRGHVYPIQVRRGHHVYHYYTRERCINGRRVQLAPCWRSSAAVPPQSRPRMARSTLAWMASPCACAPRGRGGSRGVGTVVTTGPGPDGPCVQDKDYVAELAAGEQCGRTLWETAVRWGVMDARRVVILADGAKENWAWAQMYVPGAVEILDCYHACEHLRAVRDACVRATDPAGHAWLERHCHALKHGP